MTDADELARALADLASALERLGRTWAVGGSLASGAYGEPRATNDVDIVARLLPGDASALRAGLPTCFFVDLETVEDAIRTHGSCNVLDERSYIKFDLFVPARGVLGAGQWRDVLGVLSRASVDHDYLDRSAREVGLFELLEKARAEV